MLKTLLASPYYFVRACYFDWRFRDYRDKDSPIVLMPDHEYLCRSGIERNFYDAGIRYLAVLSHPGALQEHPVAVFYRAESGEYPRPGSEPDERNRLLDMNYEGGEPLLDWVKSQGLLTYDVWTDGLRRSFIDLSGYQPMVRRGRVVRRAE